MDVLVTGANGFIGSALLSELSKDRKNRIAVVVHSRLDNIDTGNVEVFQGDLADPGFASDAVAGRDVVFHLAGKVGQWSAKRDEFYRSNVTGSVNLFNACLKEGVKKVVHTSSYFAIGPSHGAPLEADAIMTRPQRFDMEYERTKYLADREADRFVDDGLDLRRVYPTTVIGVGCVNDWGKLVIEALNNRSFVIGSGACRLNFVDVADVVRGHLLVAGKGKNGGRYVLGGVNLSLNEFYGMLSRQFGAPAPLHIPGPIAYVAAGLLEAVSAVTRRPPLLTRKGVDAILRDWAYASTRDVGYVPTSRLGIHRLLVEMVDWYRKNGYVPAKVR